MLLVTGASQGAQRINEAVFSQLDTLLGTAHIIHLTGAVGEAAARARRGELSPEARERYHVHGYLDDMPAAMAAADLAVMRAGASVLGELPAAGLPAVLVPGEYEGGHTQWPNARYLESEGAAVTLANDELDRLSAGGRRPPRGPDATRVHARLAAPPRAARRDTAHRFDRAGGGGVSSELMAGIPERVHLIGVGGMHLSGIARILTSWGHSVSGSDMRLSPMTEALVSARRDRARRASSREHRRR